MKKAFYIQYNIYENTLSIQKINKKVRKIKMRNEQTEFIKSYNESIYMPPEHASYEDVYTFAMDESYPVKYIIAGMTHPFPTYKNKRPATKKHYLFEHVTDGKGYIFINGEWHTLTKGDTYLVGKNDDRNFYSDAEFPMCKIYVSFASEYIDSMMNNYGVGAGVYRADLGEYFAQIYKASTSKELTQKEKIFTITDNIHKIIMSVAAQNEQRTSSLASQIENDLSASVFIKVSLDEIAQKFYMSKANLIRIFKQKNGITPYQFILNEKLKVAKALLSTTSMSVRSVSEKLCFADEHYFSSLFKEKVGISPLKYKAQKASKSPNSK